MSTPPEPAAPPPPHAIGPTVAEFRELAIPRLIERYRTGSSLIQRRVLDLTDEQLDTFFLPDVSIGRWSCRVLLGHIADADLVNAHRMRRIVAEDFPVLSLWDENAFIDAGLYGGPRGGADKPVAGFVAIIHAIRMWSAEWLTTLDGEQLARAALHPERGPTSVLDVLVYGAWHLEHHIAYLNLKLDRLLGPAPVVADQPRP